jgi:hypothetical protein
MLLDTKVWSTELISLKLGSSEGLNGSSNQKSGACTGQAPLVFDHFLVFLSPITSTTRFAGNTSKCDGLML